MNRLVLIFAFFSWLAPLFFDRSYGLVRLTGKVPRFNKPNQNPNASKTLEKS